ncbi:MAG: DUF542 domain-containing protein [Clostridiaceae bacterium]
MSILENKINELVREDIRLASFFQNEKIDFCCNGHRLIGEVLKEKGVDKDAFLQKLETFQQALEKEGEKDDFFKDMDNEELIGHIRVKHHLYTRGVLKDLDQYVSAIVKAHYRHDKSLLLEINRLYGSLRTELLEHLIKEEVDLFPLIIESNFKDASAQILETEKEHDAAGNILQSLRIVTNEYTLPTWGCETFRAVYHHLEALESDLFRHIFLENSVLFERVLNTK